MKIYFIYKGEKKNPNLKSNHKKLKKIFGQGYIFSEKYSNVADMKREEVRKKFTKDMKEGNFDLVVADITPGVGRFMQEEINLAKKLKIPVMEIKFVN